MTDAIAPSSEPTSMPAPTGTANETRSFPLLSKISERFTSPSPQQEGMLMDMSMSSRAVAAGTADPKVAEAENAELLSKGVPEEDKMDLSAANSEGLLMGWGKAITENTWVKSTVEAVTREVNNYVEQEEMKEIKRKYKKQIKKDKEIQELKKKIKKLKGRFKAQRLHGNRLAQRNLYVRDKQQKELDEKVERLRKAIWSFSNSSMNSHEYARGMMRAAARLKRKGYKVHKNEKALAMEAAVLRNMHRMLALQKQYALAKKYCGEVSSFIKRCKAWLDTRVADGHLHLMVLEATLKSMEIFYVEVVKVQDELIPKLESPELYTFGKQRKDTTKPLPPGLRSMPTFLKGPPKPKMKLTLKEKKKEAEKDKSNLKGYKTFKEQTKAMDKAWDNEMKEYNNLLEVGGEGMEIDDNVSDLGDSEDEIEENLKAVTMGGEDAVKKTEKDGAAEAAATEKEDAEKGNSAEETTKEQAAEGETENKTTEGEEPKVAAATAEQKSAEDTPDQAAEEETENKTTEIEELKVATATTEQKSDDGTPAEETRNEDATGGETKDAPTPTEETNTEVAAADETNTEVAATEDKMEGTLEEESKEAPIPLDENIDEVTAAVDKPEEEQNVSDEVVEAKEPVEEPVETPDVEGTDEEKQVEPDTHGEDEMEVGDDDNLPDIPIPKQEDLDKLLDKEPEELGGNDEDNKSVEEALNATMNQTVAATEAENVDVEEEHDEDDE